MNRFPRCLRFVLALSSVSSPLMSQEAGSFTIGHDIRTSDEFIVADVVLTNSGHDVQCVSGLDSYIYFPESMPNSDGSLFLAYFTRTKHLSIEEGGRSFVVMPPGSSVKVSDTFRPDNPEPDYGVTSSILDDGADALIWSREQHRKGNYLAQFSFVVLRCSQKALKSSTHKEAPFVFDFGNRIPQILTTHSFDL